MFDLAAYAPLVISACIAMIAGLILGYWAGFRRMDLGKFEAELRAYPVRNARRTGVSHRR